MLMGIIWRIIIGILSLVGGLMCMHIAVSTFEYFYGVAAVVFGLVSMASCMFGHD